MCIWENEITTNLEFILIAQVGDDGCGLSRAGCSCLMPVLNWYSYKASLSLSLCLLFFLHNHIILCVWSLSTTCVFFRQLVLSNKVWYYKMLQCDQYYNRLSVFRKRNFIPWSLYVFLNGHEIRYRRTGSGSTDLFIFSVRNLMFTWSDITWNEIKT